MIIYNFTCDKCGNVSGHMSSSQFDAPCCCGGEAMYPTAVDNVPDYDDDDEDDDETKGETE